MMGKSQERQKSTNTICQQGVDRNETKTIINSHNMNAQERERAQRIRQMLPGETGNERKEEERPSGFTDACDGLTRTSQASRSSYASMPSTKLKGSSEALADALSSSLADIVSHGNKKARAIVPQTEVGDCSEEGNGSSSSSAMNGTGEGSGPAAVTATTTTSSGDDRDSSAAGSGSNVAAVANHSFGDRGGATSLSQSLSDTNLIRHHHHRQRRPADDFGLPESRNDRFQAESARAHTVVAHLPPPSADGTTSSSGSGGEGEKMNTEDRPKVTGSLLQPHREPGFHKIRKTFNKSARRDASRSAETDTSDQQVAHHKHKKAGKRSLKSPSLTEFSRMKHVPAPGSDRGSDDDVWSNGSSSGSGTDGGYDGSASSNASSPSVSSSDDAKHHHRRAKTGLSGDRNRPMLSKKESTMSVSSEIADFSSGASESEVLDGGFMLDALRDSPSESPSITSCSNGDNSSDDQDNVFVETRARLKGRKARSTDVTRKRKQPGSNWPSPLSLQVPVNNAQNPFRRRKRVRLEDSKPLARGGLKTDETHSGPILEGKPPILSLGCDVMAHVLTFLEPTEILDTLTMPLSKDWLSTFTRQPELWRVLCLLEPFKAPVDEDNDDSSDEESYLSPDCGPRQVFGKFRLLYTSFVRCMRYLAKIQDDAMNGRSPSVIDYGAPGVANHNIGENQSLHQFLRRARGIVARNTNGSDDDGENVVRQVACARPVGISDDGSSSTCDSRKRRRCEEKSASKPKPKKPTYAHSKLTQRLLGPSKQGDAGNTELPWSCAIYSIANWMVAFSDVEGIQTMCLKVLPFLLEDEQQRITAQRAGLTDVVLRGMVMFPDSVQLHTAAFHTIVLLARPLGGREGMLFHTSMVNSSGIFSTGPRGSQSGRNGIAVMLDSMRRFQSDEALQAMSCWSLVNIALAPAQKEVLVKLGGIQVTAQAMMEHPYNAEVQFRALFALINLVIPSVSVNPAVNEAEEDRPVRLANEESSEKEVLDETINSIVSLVVLAMKNFCSSEAILNRACLVLHNLSLTEDYHSSLLWTPNCYQMLEWCLSNYRTDQVLQQSAAGTLHRLQSTLSGNEALRVRFAASIQAQQQLSLEQAHQEALLLHQQQQEGEQEQQAPFEAQP